MLKATSSYYLSIFTLIIAFSRGMFYNYIPQTVYFLFFGFISGYLILRSKSLNINFSILTIIAIAVCSIIFNDIPEKFRPWQRLMIFIIVIMPISSLISSKYTIIYRIILYKLFLKTISIITILSFIGYLSQSSFFYHLKTGTFRGLMVYCMVLGPCAGISAIYLITKYFSTKKIYYLIVGITSILVCLLSGSRGAIISFVVAFIYLSAIHFKKKLRTLIKTYLTSLIIILLVSPLLSPYLDTVRQKQENNIQNGGTFYSREKLFYDRVKEFYTNPLLGSGFASINEEVAQNTARNEETGTIEPGSSWLFILSSMGIIAFILFIYIILYRIIALYLLSNPHSYNLMLIGSTLTLFSVHMIIEGYILSAGGFLFWCAWLCIGISQKDAINYITNEKYNIL